jgi:hypothetical protein
MPRFGSEEDAKSGGVTRIPLPEDRYLVEITEFEVSPEPDNFNAGKLRDVGHCKMAVISFHDGTPLMDMTDQELAADDDRLFFDWIEVTRTGFSKGRPSKARQFIWSAFGVSTADPLEFDDWKELVGKRMIAQAVVKPDKDGIKRNKCVSYEPVRARRARPAAASPTTIPGESLAAAAPVDLTAKAQEIFGEEADFGN